MDEEVIKRISLTAARKRISPQTGWIHLWHDDPECKRQDTVPFLENFLYVYALFRTKTVEGIQEAKQLLEKLLAFEVEGNFPIYLHEFPHCKDLKLSSQLLPPLFYLLRDFSLALGEGWTARLRALSERIVQGLYKHPQLSPGARARLAAFTGTFSPDSWHPKSLEEWGEFCVCVQMAGVDFPFQQPLWNAQLGVFLGEVKERVQEGMEPAVSLWDLFMKKPPQRALNDSSVHLKASLVHPWEKKGPAEEESLFVAIPGESRQMLTFYWGDLNCTHSLVLESKKGSWKIEKCLEGWKCSYLYDKEVPSEEEAMEWAFYLNGSLDHQLRVEGEKATLFHPGEEISIGSKGCEISFQIAIDPSEGLYTGHILKGDRSFQKSKQLPYGGYDWKIGFRTVRREQDAPAQLEILVRSSVLSLAF